jgi:hypothetical protein
MAPTLAAGKQKLLDNPRHHAHFQKDNKLWISYDNATVHWKAQSSPLLKSVQWDRLPLPPHSPDMHKVIEHSHARAVKEFQQWLLDHPGHHSMEQYMFQFESVYRQCNKASVIKNDVASLPALYDWIWAHGGEWAPRALS